jgi:hypothetical protein
MLRSTTRACGRWRAGSQQVFADQRAQERQPGGQAPAGTPPGDIPLEHGTKFELVLNLRAAQALGCQFRRACASASTRWSNESAGAVALVWDIAEGVSLTIGDTALGPLSTAVAQSISANTTDSATVPSMRSKAAFNSRRASCLAAGSIHWVLMMFPPWTATDHGQIVGRLVVRR